MKMKFYTSFIHPQLINVSNVQQVNEEKGPTKWIRLLVISFCFKTVVIHICQKSANGYNFFRLYFINSVDLFGIGVQC